jgi:hypothetical protein
VKVEKLQPGRELDALVSEKVMGAEVCRCKICQDTGPNGMCESCDKPRGRFYSTHVDRALSLLEHLAATRNLLYRIERKSDAGGPQFEISLWTGDQKPAGRGSAPTLALAACRAALASV